jgi:hypothetical protein
MTPISGAEFERFVAQHQIPLVQFRKGQRKDEVMAEHLHKFRQEEAVVFVGKAQEKTSVFRTEGRRNPQTGQTYPWIVKSTAMVNHYYIYAVDRDFGPFFLQFFTYFPFNAKLCLNGHEYAKRQLAQRHRLRGARQRYPQLRRARASAEVLRRPRCGEDRRLSAQMAASASVSVHGSRSQGRLPL